MTDRSDSPVPAGREPAVKIPHRACRDKAVRAGVLAAPAARLVASGGAVAVADDAW